jgi:hypothetical protein
MVLYTSLDNGLNKDSQNDWIFKMIIKLYLFKCA